jgi:DNA primase catalytic core
MMKMKTKEFREIVELIRQRVDIVDVIGSRIQLSHGNMGVCPFHDDHDPSLSVNAEGQYFYCFGCLVGGDVFRFRELYEHKSFVQVLREFGQEVGIDVQAISKEDQKELEKQRAIEEVLDEALNYYEGMLSPEVQQYLVETRSLSPSTVRRFHVGYAHGDLRSHLVNKCGLPEELCIEAGVLKRNPDGSSRDFFRERVVFPFIQHGQVIFLTGRSIDNAEPKYLNLPGPIRGIFNEEALNKNEVILVEGVIDCLSLVQAGFDAAALHGLNLRPEYVERLSRHERVYICLDADKAGREAAMKIGQLVGQKSRIVELPEGQDPNDYLRSHSAEEFKGLLMTAKTPLTMELESIPTDTPKTELPGVLASFLQRLAQLDKPTVEAWISDRLKTRFDLKTRDLDAYRAIVNEYRHEQDDSSDSESEDTKAKPSAMFDGLVDVVEDDGEPAFLIKEGEELRIVKTVEINSETYKPPDSKYIPWLLADGDRVVEFYEQEKKVGLDADKVLFDDLVEYHKGISELPGVEYYHFFAAWDLHTYLPELVRYTPIICLFSVPERGKSRTGKGLIHVARRGIHVESLRDAYLVRIAENWQAAVFFDVRDIWGRVEKSGSEDVLLSRFEKGIRVPRVLFPDKGPHEDTVYYSIFGPTIIATNESVHQILETRAVTIHMPETSRSFESDVIPENALEMKARLLAFRARYMGKQLPEMDKPAKGRLGDILRPLLQIIMLVRPEQEEAFRSLVKKLQDERVIEKSTSLEAELLQVIMACEVWVERGSLSVKEITEKYNSGKETEREKITPQRVGRRLAAMGFQKVKTGNGSAAIRWDRSVIAQMCATYGIEQSSETPEMPESPSGTERGDKAQVLQAGGGDGTTGNAEEGEDAPDPANKDKKLVDEEDWATKMERPTKREDTTDGRILFREMDIFKEFGEQPKQEGPVSE